MAELVHSIEVNDVMRSEVVYVKPLDTHDMIDLYSSRKCEEHNMIEIRVNDVEVSYGTIVASSDIVWLNGAIGKIGSEIAESEECRNPATGRFSMASQRIWHKQLLSLRAAAYNRRNELYALAKTQQGTLHIDKVLELARLMSGAASNVPKAPYKTLEEKSAENVRDLIQPAQQEQMREKIPGYAKAETEALARMNGTYKEPEIKVDPTQGDALVNSLNAVYEGKPLPSIEEDIEL